MEYVNAGDLLIQLDATQLTSQLSIVESQLYDVAAVVEAETGKR